MTPQSRKQQILTQHVGDELVIYDERTHKAHRLNVTAAHVWETADGVRTVPELADHLRATLSASGRAIEPDESEELVRLALEDLNRAGLLRQGLPSMTDAMTRRQMMVITAALLPVVASILAPTPAETNTFNNTTSIPVTTSTPGNTSPGGS
jgi:hypothetical protein